MEEEWELRMASEENRDCVCVCAHFVSVLLLHLAVIPVAMRESIVMI